MSSAAMIPEPAAGKGETGRERSTVTERHMSNRTLRIPAELKNLAEIREFVERAATELGVDEGIVDDMVLAVDEAATNIILHGYELGGGMIEMEIRRDGDALQISLRDEGTPFDPTCFPEPDLHLSLEMRAPGGMGIHLIRQVVDEVNYCTTPQGRNELTLVKRGLEDPGPTSDPAGPKGAD
ncbi:MAG: ATP-binding protein [Anaerolineales bacterium]|nr:MAG: ATP-binding protein [Anaerolineales bacterium]